ncbi:hypothetical protein BH10ACT5_BH10ACT5_18970 [soil metagenome]
MARVSVVIPSFNSGVFLERAVATVLAQTASDLEVVVIDDGSDHPQVDIGDLDDRVRFHQQQNRGVSIARNVGVALARSELIAFMDHDDEWHPKKLERQLAMVDEHPRAAFWCTGFDWVADATEVVARADAPTYQGLLSTQHVLLSSVLVRRDNYTAVGGHNPLLAQMQDWDLLLRLAMDGGVPVIAQEQLVRYHLHDSNASRDYRRAVAERLSILADHERRAIQHNDRATLAAIAVGRARTRELFAYQAVEATRSAVTTDRRAAFQHFAFASRMSPSVATRAIAQAILARARHPRGIAKSVHD